MAPLPKVVIDLSIGAQVDMDEAVETFSDSRHSFDARSVIVNPSRVWGLKWHS